MADPGNPKAFFTDALTACDALENDKRALLLASQNFKETGKAVSSLEKTIEKEKTDLLKKRRADIEAEYQKQLQQAENAVSEAKAKRMKTREQGMKERIEAETKGLKAEIAALKDARSQTVSLTCLPSFCKTDLYYALFSPVGFKEVLAALLIFAVCLVLLPAVVTAGVRHIAVKILLFILIDAGLIGLYMLIYHRSLGTGEQAVKKCREITSQIKNSRRVIRKITATIKKDKDDSYYNLSGCDAEITKLTEAKNAIILRRQEALSVFDNETASGIKAEIDGRYVEKLAQAKEDLRQYELAQKELTEKIAGSELSLNSEFTQYIGKENMTHEKLEKMLSLVENEAASGVQDAVIKVNQK